MGVSASQNVTPGKGPFISFPRVSGPLTERLVEPSGTDLASAIDVHFCNEQKELKKGQK